MKTWVKEEKTGWIKNATGYWYRKADGTFPANAWHIINNHYYLFNRDGKNADPLFVWLKEQAPEGDWFFLDNTKDGPLEGACWHSKDNGAQEIWFVAQENNL